MAFKNVTTLLLLSATISLCCMEDPDFNLSGLSLSQESGKPELALTPMDGDTTPKMSISDKFKQALKMQPKTTKKSILKGGVGKQQKEKNPTVKRVLWADRRKNLDPNFDPKNCVSKNSLAPHRSDPVYKK